MNKKKIIQIILIVIVIILTYFNYFSPEKQAEESSTKIETLDIKYSTDDYELEAEKQIDNTDKKEILFEKARASIKDLLLSGNRVLIDKANNIKLTKGVRGLSKTGWKFEAENLFYENEKDELLSETDVFLFNEIENIRIRGKKFKSDSSMKNIFLNKDVVLESNNIDIYADKANYNEKNNKIDLSGNVKILSKNSESNLKAELNSLTYDLETELFYSNEHFEISDDKNRISANKIILSTIKESFEIENNIEMSNKSYVVTAKKIVKKENNNIVEIIGDVKAVSKSGLITADKGFYNILEDEIVLTENLTAFLGKENKIIADKLVSRTGLTEFYSNKDKVEVIFNGDRLYTDKFSHDENKGILFSEGEYKYVGKDLYEINGDSFEYFRLEKKLNAIGKVKYQDKEKKVESSDVSYNELNQFVNIPNEFEIKDLKSNITLRGKKATFDGKKGDFISIGAVDIEGNDYIISAINLNYNIKSGIGELEKDVKYSNKVSDLGISADRLEFKKDDYVHLLGSVELKDEGLNLSTDLAKYSFEKNIVRLPNESDFTSADGKFKGKTFDSYYHLNDKIIKGKNFIGKGEQVDITAKNLEYYLATEELRLVDDVEILNENNKFKGKELNYFIKERIVSSKKEFKVSIGNINMKFNSGEVNSKSGDIFGAFPNIDIGNGDSLQADYFNGNINKLFLKFSSNAKGVIKISGNDIYYSADNIIFDLQKIKDKYEIFKVEAKGNVDLKQKELELKSDYLEYTIKNLKLFARDRVNLLIRNPENKKDYLIVNSESLSYDINKYKAIFIDNVYFEKNDNTDKIIGKAKKAEFEGKKNLLEMIGNVNIVYNESELIADKVSYNIKTSKLKASGQVNYNYKK